MNRLLTAATILALCASAGALWRFWEPQGDRYLLIHADDAGLCASVNRATIAAMEHGVVSSASIMVPCPGFEEFAEYALSQPEKDFGVHLTVTSEWDDLRWGPVTDPKDVPSLIDASGTFRRTANEFAKHARLEEVELEVRAQIRTAQERGILLSHLDCHMNALLRRPDLMRLLVRISDEVDLPLRFAKRLPDGWEHVLPRDVIDAYYAQLKVLYTRHNPMADLIEYDNYAVPPEEKRAYFLNVLRNLKPGVTEFVVHCCDTTSDDWCPPDAAGRQVDTDLCVSPEFAHEVQALGIQIIDWKDFRQMSSTDLFDSP